MWWLALLACRPNLTTLTAEDFTLEVDHETGGLTVTHPLGARWTDLRFPIGTGSAEIETQLGAWAFRDEQLSTRTAATFAPLRGRGKEPPYLLELLDAEGARLAHLTVVASGDVLWIDVSPAIPADRVGFEADCEAEEHFLGFGGHAMDVDHVGQAFPLWVGEPGIGKTTTEEEPAAWPLEGTRHDASYPVPFALRPHQPSGTLLDTTGRVVVDLCASDPDRWSMTAWDEGVSVALVAGPTARSVIQTRTALTGRGQLPPGWAFGAWGDAIRGRDRVEEVAAQLRDIGAAVTVIWSEDWKGAEETITGFRLKGEWFLDEELYPDAPTLTDQLEAQGFKWFGYFSPFLDVGDATYEDALAHDAVVRNADGEPYTFLGVRFQQTTLVDVSTPSGRDWAAGYFTAALDLGLDGWMTDYGEWLPVDAVLGSGESALLRHNRYPEWWQQAHLQAIEGRDATFFARSGWTASAALAPITWAGDQSTDFAADDGLPTVVAMGLGYGASGVPVFTHDVAGYQSLGTDPTTKELWFRWAGLGAYSPVYRLHHGSSTDANHQWDRDEETLAHYAATTREHMRLWPYRYGLARRAFQDGVPMVLPVAVVVGGGDWGRMDAWMLGDALLVAPVLEEGALTREVDLPASHRWWTWPGLEPASSGEVEAPPAVTPVFAAGGTTVPTFDTIPDTLVAGAQGLLTLDDVDHQRVVYLFDGGGDFTEGDGTTYRPTGQPTGAGEATATFRDGTIEVAGVRLTITGPVERTYRVVTR